MAPKASGLPSLALAGQKEEQVVTKAVPVTESHGRLCFCLIGQGQAFRVEGLGI